LDLFNRHVAARPDDPLAFALRGQVLRKLGRVSQAEADFSKALLLKPDDPRVWKLRGLSYAMTGLPDEAATAFAKVMELTPESKEAALWWSPDPAGIGEALAPHDEIFGRLVQIRPRNRTLLIARFHYFGRRHRWREAAEMVARIIELDPKDDSARGYHRALLLFTGDVEGYRRACRDVLAARKQVNPNVGGWFQLLGQFEFPRAVEIGPLPPGADASSSRGITAYREGQYASTIRELAGVLDSTRHPYRLTLAHLFLAMAHQRLGQVAEARRELDAARKLLDGLGRIYGFRDSTEGELMDYGWTEWVQATIIRNEAEALIVYDPIFPADPFAR
jgi:tetratricopeptide (TPR) repeat protein